MPKAAMHEDYSTVLAQDNIWLSRQVEPLKREAKTNSAQDAAY
jgi:hypothetical protein